MKNQIIILFILSFIYSSCSFEREMNTKQDFTENWRFILADSLADYSSVQIDDSDWRLLNLPHDWSIEYDFSEKNPASPGGGALPGGIGWYRKTFNIDINDSGKRIYIDFDGIYQNSEVWINGNYLGKRPNGYISFRNDLTPYIKFGEDNIIAVKVDNSEQPNSRWYSGSGIYRNVWLEIKNNIHIDQWGVYVTTPKINGDSATINISVHLKNNTREEPHVSIENILLNDKGKVINKTERAHTHALRGMNSVIQEIEITNPVLWSVENPHLYKVVSRVKLDGEIIDEEETSFGIRSFEFDAKKGLLLNGEHIKINGVCNHHDLGCLGAAVNTRAIERQLEILKEMGCNGIRCAHNPPAPELLDLCDKMGFIVMNEAFDMWRKKKTTHDYSQYFAEWYEKDLKDLILRDRNHPSVFIWSIGNEVLEQWSHNNMDNINLQDANVLLNQTQEINEEDYISGKTNINTLLTQRLVEIVKTIDPYRPVTAGCNETKISNHLFQSKSLDIIGFNYHLKDYAAVPENFPGKPFIATETVSGLMSRGYYMMPSDSMFIWPESWDKPFFRDINQCSSYDNCHVPWGNSHEESWKSIKNSDFIAGQYIWTGFDYLGEPTPFWWPSRSSYFGIIDLAGFPKDIYFMYQSEWTDKNVLHIFPHWNWEPGKLVDIWVYYNNADEVELYLNNKSLGVKKKENNDLHICWRVPFEAGSIKAISRKKGKEILSKEIKTAGKAVSIRMTPDREKIVANGKDLSFITVEAIDENGNIVSTANDLIAFSIEGDGTIAGTDNGDPTDHNSLKKPERRLFNGKCLVVIQSGKTSGNIKLKAKSEYLQTVDLIIDSE